MNLRMKVDLKILFVIVLTISARLLGAQSDHVSFGKISATAISSDFKQTAIATEKFIYIVDNLLLKKVDSIPVVGIRNFSIASMNFDHKDFIIAKYGEQNMYNPDLIKPRFQFEENPQDSILIYSTITKQVGTRLTGNCYVAVNSGNIFLATYNNVYEWKDNYGNVHFGSQKGEIVLYNGDEDLRAFANGSIKSLCISPNEKYIALHYYVSDSLIIEIRSTADLSVLSTMQFPGSIDEIKFSDDNQFIIGMLNELGSVSKTRVFSFEGLNEIEFTDIQEDLLKNKIENGTVWVLEDNSIVQKELKTGQKKSEIWANLTPFSFIKNFYKINDDELLVIGSGSNLNPQSGENNGIYKYSLRQNKVYSDFSGLSNNIDTTQFFDPAQIVFQNNIVIEGKKQFSEDGSIMMIHSEAQIQLWDTKKRMKIYDFTFDAAVNPYINRECSEILIFKKYDGKGYSEFYLQKLNLKNGKLISKLFIDNPRTFISPANGGKHCSQSKDDSNKWFYLQRHSNYIWEIDLASMKIDSLFQFKKVNYEDYSYLQRVLEIPGSGNLLLEVEIGQYLDDIGNNEKVDTVKSGFFLLKTKEKSISKLNGLKDIPNLFPVSENKCVGISKNSNELFWYDLNAQKTTLIRKLNSVSDENKSNDFVFLKNKKFTYFIQNSPKFNGDLIVNVIDLNSGNWSREFTLKAQTLTGLALFGDYFFLTNSIVYDDFFVKSYNPETQQALLWNVKKIDERFNSMQVDSNIILSKQQDFIDLSEFSVHKEGYHTFQLLKQQNILLDTYTGNPFSSEYNTGFCVEAFAINALDTVKWTSNIVKYKSSESYFLDELQISPDENFALFGFSTFFDFKNKICVVDLKTHELTMRSLPYKITAWGIFDNSTYWVIKANDDNYTNTEVKLEYFDFSTGKKADKEIIEKQMTIVDNPKIDFQNVLFQSKNYYARDYLSQAIHLKEKNRLIACGSKLHFWEVGNSSPVKQLQLGSSYIDQFEIEGHLLYAACRDGAIYVVDIDEMALKLILNTVEKNGSTYLAAFTPEGYFKAPKELMKDFHFVKNGKIFPLANYELFLNRPDIIFSTLGFTDEQTVEMYKQAYLKRLKRNGFSENTDFLNMEVPTVQFENVIPDVSTKKNIDLHFSFSNDAVSYSVLINGVPLANRSIEKSLKARETVELLNGENNISVIARNRGGIESDPEFIKVSYSDTSYKSKIHYVGIGVSNYKDSVWNLQYADNDVRRLSWFFNNKNYFQSEITVDSLINEQVTKANYLALKNKLLQTNVNDLVIVSLSGHGLLDKNNDFYFATNDVNFQNPEEKGLSYEEILSILDEIPARKKMLLIDACHSGEADIESIKDWKTVNDVPLDGGKKGAEVEGLNSENQLAELSFEIMKNTFQDMVQGNGTYVISASGAKEFAVEEGGNGIFTMSFINAIADWQWNSKGQITVSELQKDVYERVLKLSGGQQKPMTRSENTSWDWVIE